VTRFTAHLWKEWRTHRLALLVTLLGFPLALAVVVTLSGAPYVRDWVFAPAVAAAGLVCMLVGVGGELLAERGERGVSWLERVPGGLGSAFAAKLTFLLLSSSASLAVAGAIVLVVAGVRGEPMTGQPLPLIGAWFVLSLPVVVWTFALSAWALRGGLAFVTALFLLGLVVGPGIVLVTQGYRAVGGPLVWSVTLLPAVGLLAAWLAFVPRRMRGAGRGRVLATVGLPALAFLPPAWIWSAARWSERTALDPEHWNVTLAVVTRDARHVVTLVKPEARGWDWNVVESRVVRIDLDSGAWEAIGGGPADLRVELAAADASPRTLMASTATGAFALDPGDGAVLEDAPDVEAWSGAAGLGRWTYERGEMIVVDPFRERSFPRQALGTGLHSFKVLPGRWLVRTAGDWHWLDPETLVTESTGWKDLHRTLEAVLADGRVVLREWDRSANRCALWLLDPGSGTNRELWAGPGSPHPAHLELANGGAEARPLFSIDRELFVLEPETAELRGVIELPAGRWRVAGWTGADQVLLHAADDGRLLRVDVAASTSEVVFPR
jgi:hypothetical protein